ncbi:MAG TPA: 6-bladed beta-propeller [Chitinophagaceae bacterium]|nr:6-bladed beta-propeller [Chitinophagaceae bacterium]
MDRRKFIQQTSVATSGILFLPSLLQDSKKDDIILGQNNKRYRLNKEWSQVDAAKYPVKDCHEMVQDSKGRIILLTNEVKNNVIIYDKKGQLIDTWGHEYPGAHGLTLFNENGQEVLFICDNNRHQMIKTDLNGKVLMVLDYPKETGQYTKAEEYIPTETAIADNGDIYVVDGYGKDFVIQYDYKGNYIRHFGGRGNKEENLLNAHGICIDHRYKDNPTLIVTSRQQNAFKRFTMDGRFINTIALPGAWVCRPVINGDYLYSAVLQSSSHVNEQSGFVTILDKNFKVVSNLGGNNPTYTGDIPDEMHQTIKAFQYPHDVLIDDEQNMYVAQWNSGHVYPYKLDPVV